MTEEEILLSYLFTKDEKRLVKENAQLKEKMNDCTEQLQSLNEENTRLKQECAKWKEAYFELKKEENKLSANYMKARLEIFANQYGLNWEDIIFHNQMPLEKIIELVKEEQNRISIGKTEPVVEVQDKRIKGARGVAGTAYKRDINVERIGILYSEGKSMNQISKQLGCSIHTVKSRLKAIKAIVEEDC